MVSQLTQNYSSLKKSTWPHLLLIGQLGQTGSNLVKLVKNLYSFGAGHYNTCQVHVVQWLVKCHSHEEKCAEYWLDDLDNIWI